MATVTYNDLINKSGTIYTTSGKAYSTPTQLATDLGILPHQIDWTKITAAPTGQTTTTAPTGQTTTTPNQTTTQAPGSTVPLATQQPGTTTQTTSTAPQTTAPTYVRQTGTTDVYNVSGGTPQYVSFEEANKNNIWGQVQDVGNISQYGVTTQNLNTLTGPKPEDISQVGPITDQSPALQAGGDVNTYLTNAGNDLISARTTLENSYNTQIKALQDQQKALQDKIDSYTSKAEGALEGLQDVTQPWQQQYEEAERQRLLVEQNYFDNQNSIKELESLMNKATADIQYTEQVTGLSSIRNPRISEIKTDYAARVGVIEAVMAARNNQISVATNLIDRGINAIANDKQGQIDYYKTVMDFYGNLRSESGERLINLSNQEKTYVDAKIGLLENDLSRLQETQDYIKQLMIDPATARAMEQAGVKLTDSIETINQKLSQYTYTKEVQDKANEMASDGYRQLLPGEVSSKPADQVSTITDSKGNVTYWYNPTRNVKDTGSTISGGDTPGSAIFGSNKTIAGRFDADLEAEIKAVYNGDYGVEFSREEALNRLLAKYPPEAADDIREIIYGVDANGNPSTRFNAAFPDGYESRIEGGAAQNKFITVDFLRTMYPTIDSMLEALGKKRADYSSAWHGNTWEEEQIKKEFNTYLEGVMKSIEQYRSTGQTDEEILKSMQ